MVDHSQTFSNKDLTKPGIVVEDPSETFRNKDLTKPEIVVEDPPETFSNKDLTKPGIVVVGGPKPSTFGEQLWNMLTESVHSLGKINSDS